MNDKNEEKKEKEEEEEKGTKIDKKAKREDWFKKLDRPFKSINYQYARLFYKKKEISKNQKLLNDYSIKNQQKQKYIIHKEEKNLDEKLLKRFNIYNYKSIDTENNIMKKILSKIEERHNNKRNRNIKLKRFKTNNDYDKMFSSKKINNNISTKQNHKKLNLLNINMNYSSLNNSSISVRNKILNKFKNLKLNLNTDNNSENSCLPSPKSNRKIDYFLNNYTNENNEDNNFFKTLTRVEKYQINNNNIPNRIDNIIQMMKVIKDEEEKYKLLNRNIFNLKKIKRFSNSVDQNKNINKSINYSKIKNRKDIEEKIFKVPQICIYDYLKNKIKLNYKKRTDNVNNNKSNKYLYKNKNNINRKSDIILPICPTSHKEH